MLIFSAVDANFESREGESFDRQMVMQTIGARLDRISLGEVRIEIPFNPALTPQHAATFTPASSASLSTAPVDTPPTP